MAVSASVVYTGESGNMSGDNTGAAFFERGDALDISQQEIARSRELAREKRDREKEVREQWRNAIMPTEDLWLDEEEEELNAVINEYDNMISGFAQRGAEFADLSSDEIKQKKQLEARIKLLRTQSDQNKAYYDQIMSEFQKDPDGLIYDPEKSTKMLEEFRGSGKSIEARNEVARKNGVLPKRYDFSGVTTNLAKVLPDTDLPGNKTGKDPKAFELVLDDFLASPEGDLMIRETNEAEGDIKKRLLDEFNVIYRPKSKPVVKTSTKAPTAPKSDFSLTPTATGTGVGKYKNLEFNVMTTPNSPGQSDLFWDSGYNTINIPHKALSLYDNSGNPQQVTVQSVYQGPNGTVLRTTNSYNEEIWIDYSNPRNKSTVDGAYQVDFNDVFEKVRSTAPSDGGSGVPWL